MEFVCEYGSVRFYSEELFDCCGVGVVYDVRFYPINKNKLYEEFDKYLMSNRDIDCYSLDDKNKLLMSDGLPNKEPQTNSIAEFCRHTGWYEGTAKYNRNSGNYVVLFEKDRPGR